MNISVWIAIYMPIIVLFLVIIPQQRAIQRTVIARKRMREGLKRMTHDVIKKYVGRVCQVSTGAYGIKVTGTIISVTDNWIEIETKKDVELVNAEFVQYIKIK